ncbi:MAG: methyltransferase domain-containing protein [Candidatus Omnitrophica bacterium]|nr:methyltransferase domain-containing protein [Candidatus Omnitrophota bacterium]
MCSFLVLLCVSMFIGCAGEKTPDIQGDREVENAYRYWEYWVMPDRDMVFYPEKAVSLLALGQGDVVADVGAGAGYFTFPLARAVGPAGRVYAVDIRWPYDLKNYFEERMSDRKANPYDNITLVKNEVRDITLPENSVDMAFFLLSAIFLFDPNDEALPYDLRSTFNDQRIFMKSVYKALKPGGRIAVIDLVDDPRQEEISMPGGSAYGMLVIARDLDIVKRNFESIGLRFVEEQDLYLSAEHGRQMGRFKDTDMYRMMSEKQRFFHGRYMFFFIFEKPAASGDGDI